MTTTTETTYAGALERAGEVTMAAVVAAVEEERAALAEAMHDDLLQLLVATRYAADLMERHGPGSADLRATISDALVAARDVVWSLHPRTAGGLEAALAALADRLTAPGVAVRTTVSAGGDPVADALAYRLVQEAAENAVRRQGAARVDVDVAGRDGTLWVRFAHDGTTAGEVPGGRWARRVALAGGRIVPDGPGWLAELPMDDGGSAS